MDKHLQQLPPDVRALLVDALGIAGRAWRSDADVNAALPANVVLQFRANADRALEVRAALLEAA